ECCYTWSGSLVSTEDGRGGQTFFYHPRYVRQHEKYDVLPKQWCCQFTDNCQYFYHVRPMDHCWGYTPLYIGWFYGDPHIRTLDGFQYTFNGLGEYTLIETTHGNFTLQGRTAKARDANGTETDATVFSAFAAKDVDSDTVHVEMSGTRDGLVVFVENTNVTDWFDGANVTDEKVVGNVALTKKNVTQIEASFKSGFSLTIGVSAEQLDITVGASDKFKGSTKGLMGVFNDDPSDDLLPPGENAVPLSNSSSEKTIFTEFGELWRIQSIDSLFYYAPDESYSTFAHTEFQPVFLTDAINAMSPAQKAKANQTCGVNKECLFDFAVTGNEDAAAAALATNNNNQATASSLANGSPNITVDSVFNATVGQNNTLTVTTSDPDGDTVNVTLDSMLPQDATWEANVYTWTPGNMNPLNISFSASDGNGGVAAAVVSVNLCNCSGHGECLFGLLADGYELKQTFRIVQCNCSTGWEGVYCELDLDGCQDNPCTEGTNCTDLTPAEQVTSGKSYNCSDCPEGTEDNEGTCLPINECDHENPRHDCEQICVDTAANYTCTCRDGYRLMDNGRNCTDINECDERTSGCEQECKNTDGSFVCSCFNDYTRNTDNMTCTMSQTLNDKCSHMNCSYGCKNQSNNYVCICQTGYTLNNDNTTCDDVDECGMRNGGCVHNCTNFEGGFNCSCNDGFRLMNDKKGCKPCQSGTWGKDCLLDCNCLNSDTVCDITTGCAECPVGFTGGDCRVDIDECANSPCDEHATCNNTIGTFKCVCQAGYTQYNSTTCQDFDECESDPCLNGAECKNGAKEYMCTCVSGYTGRNCETDIDDCDGSPCQHNGTCTDLTNRYRCTCVRGFRGRDCETEIAICDSNPCKNNGSCSQDNGNYRCNCVAGYIGHSCETDFDECTSKPCQNGANCSTPVFNSFSCQCLPGFTGERCMTNIDECENDPCMNNGTCEDQVNGFVCNCISGYTGSTCETDFDECKSNPCQNGANCSTPDFNSFSCQCLPGFTGECCETNFDECTSNPCQNGANCSTPNFNRFSCRCLPGFTGERCETSD
ncbi:Mucin-like protein, partial [Lamellibrachia satsuma]